MMNLRNHKLARTLNWERLESKYLLSAVGFIAHDLMQRVDAISVNSVQAADIDGDGDNDVLSVSSRGDSIAWHENTDGKGNFGSPRIIISTADAVNSAHAADLDGDGDLDVLSASFLDDKIAWYQNIDGTGMFGPQEVITEDADGAHSVYSADLDSDGDMDVLFASFLDDKISWSQNTDGQGTFGPPQAITVEANGVLATLAADLDGDGDQDVVYAAIGHTLEDGKIAWHENLDGTGSFGPLRVIATGVNSDEGTSLHVADLDRDGDLDVVSTSEGGLGPPGSTDGHIAWHENLDGLGGFAVPRIISTGWRPTSVFATDVNLDGDVDIVSSSFSNNTIAWHENLDGRGTYGAQQVITDQAEGANYVFASDLDHDGDLDVLSASIKDGRIAWHENRLAGDADDDGDVAFSDFLRLSANFGKIDAVWEDGDFDASEDVTFADFLILAGNFGESRPNQKPDANEDTESSKVTFSAVEHLSPVEGEATSMNVGDLDGDGDEDLLLASTNMLTWYENSGTDARFGEQHVIVAAVNVGRNLYRSPSTADLDQDGDLDVLAADFRTGIVWFENMDEGTSFGPQREIPIPLDEVSGGDEVFSVAANDLDGDGDADLLAVYDGAGPVWHENINSAGTFGPARRIGEKWNFDPQVAAVDLDGDGDLDVLANDWLNKKLIWYENVDGSGDFGRRHVIPANHTQSTGIPVTVDVEGDGDLDILGVEGWFENEGAGTFVERENLLYADFDSLLTTADIDGDGDSDALWASRDNIVWAENKNDVGRWEREYVIDSIGSKTFAAWGWPMLPSDIDDDGDIDVLLIRPTGDKVVLLENA